MKKLFFWYFFSTSLLAQQDLSLRYYLPNNVTFSDNIPKPQDVLGFIPGQWHVSHDKLVHYLSVLALASPRITLVNRGHTFENRPLILLTITSEDNHQELQKIQDKHILLTNDPKERIDVRSLPSVVYQGFSIHGNEPSGSNASLLLAYYLAAAQGEQIENLLDNVVILLDPSLNPDGLQRFANWVNKNKSKNLNYDPNDREYHEDWPVGRTNHYWFDMNRDWLPIQLPESKVRIKTYHQWYPNILTDHHEMGTNSTFFFQPGIPSRTHPLTPKQNQILTKKIANYHVKAFDAEGSLYYSEENFDDYYYGKGSTYPDINGGVGILFEQASSRGHAQKTPNGIITFPFTIKNQLIAALSTLQAAKDLRIELHQYKRTFYNSKASSKSYIFGNEKDLSSTSQLAHILLQHKIKIHHLKQDLKIDNSEFKKGASFIVSGDQPQRKLIESIFERRTTFKDSLFYDVSAWTLPLAFNMKSSDNISITSLGKEVDSLVLFKPKRIANSAYAYLMRWDDYYSPKVLYKVLEKGIKIRVGMKPFTLNNVTYDYGTLLIPVQNQPLASEELNIFLNEVVNDTNVNIEVASTGLTQQGVDLGSRQFRAVKLPKIGLFTGEGITPYDAGEVWYLMDQRYDIPITKLKINRLEYTNLSEYTHLILPSCNEKILTGIKVQKLKKWVKNGGILIGYGNTAKLFKLHKLMNIEFLKPTFENTKIKFDQLTNLFGARGIGGAIFEVELDRSHPVNFGYSENRMPIFRNSTLFVKPNEHSYNNPIRYSENPLLSGYVHSKNLEILAGTASFVNKKMGKGSVILFVDNTNFRGFWYGTNKQLMNTIFFGYEM